MPCAVIMAGGRGERFWPRSRMAHPKQFLNLVGDKTMLQLTVERLEGLVEINNTYIVAGAGYKEIILEQLPELPADNIISEPLGRDTAAAIGLAALVLERRDPREVMLVLPADHYINDVPRFREVLRAAIAAAGRGEHLVTLGVTPCRPETGYGYICRGEVHDYFGDIPACRALHFKEKPGCEQAREYLASGNYLWNSGIFAWRADLILRLIETYIPELAMGLKRIREGMGTPRHQQILEEAYLGLPGVSVDYGIMERAENILVVPGDFGWDDIGAWPALARYAAKDGDGNVLEGRGVLLDASDTYVFSRDKTVAVLGVADLIVVNDRDSLLVCHKERAQEIKRVLQALKEGGFEEVL